MQIERQGTFAARLEMPGDKSISHRALLLAALAPGRSQLVGLAGSLDVTATKHCLRALGIEIVAAEDQMTVEGQHLSGWHSPSAPLDCENSGTTMRLLAGLLAASRISTTLIGDASLTRRPMQRVVDPLERMNAAIQAFGANGRPPLSVVGRPLTAIDHQLPVASAQVKSALLLAAIHTQGVTRVWEKHPTRDHTERMLRAFGASISTAPGVIELEGEQMLQPCRFSVPGDISSAAFFLVLAAAIPGSVLTIDHVGLNPTRTGVVDVLTRMGANIECRTSSFYPEPVGSITVRGGDLRGFDVSGSEVPRLIDELPVLAVAASLARGRTQVRDAAELRVKESDRISALLTELAKMGVQCQELPDGFVITGGRLQGADVDSHGDHRLAMALAIAGCCASGTTFLRGADSVDVSYPEFFRVLNSLNHRREG